MGFVLHTGVISSLYRHFTKNVQIFQIFMEYFFSLHLLEEQTSVWISQFFVVILRPIQTTDFDPSKLHLFLAC